MAKQVWYRLGPGCEYDGLTAGTTIMGVREAQMKVLKKGFMFPDGTLLAGAPPIMPEEWFGFGEDADEIRELYLSGGMIVHYEPTESELNFAYEHMYPGLKPTPAPQVKKRKTKKVDESVSDALADVPLEDSEVDDV